MALRRVSFRQTSVAVEILSASLGLILPAKISGKSSADTESASLSAAQAQLAVFYLSASRFAEGRFQRIFQQRFR